MTDRERLIKACLFRAQHRGSREADMVIGGFAHQFLGSLDDKALGQFAEILTWDDAPIFAWIQVEQQDGHEGLRQSLRAFQQIFQSPS